MSQILHNSLKSLIETRSSKDLDITLNENIINSLKINGITLSDVYKSPHLNKIGFKTSEDDDVKWKFVSVIGYVLLDIALEKKSDSNLLLSVNLQNCIKGSLEFVISIGLLPVLIPGVGIPIEKRTEYGLHIKNEEISIVQKYDRLKSLCNLFIELCNTEDIKLIIYTNFLKDYLSALFQLSYAPVLKPGKSNKDKSFIMTDDFWNTIQSDQIFYKDRLNTVVSTCHRPSLIKELLILQSDKGLPSPAFMVKALSNELSNILLSNDGLLSIMRCFLDSDVDIGENWKQIDLIKRLISVKHGSHSIDEYLSNICNQIKNILTLNRALKINEKYVSVCASCITNLYEQYPKSKQILDLIQHIINPFVDVRSEESANGTLILSFAEVNESVKILDLCFNVPKLCLMPDFLTPIIYQIFCLRIHTRLLKKELDHLLINHFQSRSSKRDEWFEALILKKPSKDISVSNDRVFELLNEQIQIKYLADEGNVSIDNSVSCMLEIVEEHINVKDLASSFFVFCLKSAMSYKVNNKNNSNEFLIHEEETYDLIDKDSENLLILIKALQRLILMSSIIESLNEDPKIIFDFITTLLKDYREGLLRESVMINVDCVLISLTLFAVLLSQCSNRDILRITLRPALSDINHIKDKSPREDVRMLCNEINTMMSTDKSTKKTKPSSEFGKAVDEICDPLLPVRAHGLMHLTKLIEKKDVETISKKHYVQCIFEENLKSDDSYIYLAAINGLAAIANYSAEDVLEVLTREFLNSKKDLKGTAEENDEISQIRMKIGEVLVKVTKNLGDMAAAHKGILLNTFLIGCKDSDDLVRASSLSNLAEVSRVLSYKLSSVLYEMLNCFNSILETDPSPECRQAAVLVVSSLLKGLGSDALVFLKDALLPIYRTLKKLYQNESEDSTVRLHAQIALEELNAIVKDVLFPPIKLEKQIFILDRPM